jgi:hypothetical protein
MKGKALKWQTPNKLMPRKKFMRQRKRKLRHSWKPRYWKILNTARVIPTRPQGSFDYTDRMPNIQLLGINMRFNSQEFEILWSNLKRELAKLLAENLNV